MADKEQPGALFSSALRKHLDGDLVAAEADYRDIILANPGDAQARNFLGFLLQQTDRLQEAFDQLTDAIALDSRHADWHFNLGIVQARLGLVAAAIEAFSRALEIDPNKYFYWTNLGAAYEENDEPEQAERCYKAAANIDPKCADAFYLLAALCLKLERYAEARHFNYCGIAVAPASNKSMAALGQAYFELGRVDDAIALFEKWLIVEPDNPVALHLLAAYRGQQVPEQCSRQFVEQTFNTFADTFESVLGRLKYCGPQLVRDYLDGQNISPSSLSVLDLGCGTGMVGEAANPYARELVGVDLSPAMLERAATKQLYRQLHQSDIAEFLRTSGEQYDLITCMDTFIYLGRLEEVLALIRQNLKPGGILLFSTEKMSGPPGPGYQLNISGRYSHHPEYLSETLASAGLNIRLRNDVVIRMESGCPVAGEFICAIRLA